MPCQAVVQYVVVGHNKVFAPSQGGPSPPSSVTSLDNSPHFKPGSPPGQLCSSRKRLLRNIWSLLGNSSGLDMSNIMLPSALIFTTWAPDLT